MKYTYALLWILLAAPSARADMPPAEAEAAVRAADDAFWKAYNTCDVAAMSGFFSEDIEFYHDKGGLTKTRAGLTDSIKKNLCSNPKSHLRREAIADSVKSYPLAGNRVLLVGEHRFYVNDVDKPEFLDGQARFDDLWEYADGHWRMSRVFSYSHGPAAYPPPAAIELSAAELSKLAGRYTSGQSGDIEITVDGSHLKLISGTHTFTIFALSPTQFFSRERDLRFEFSAPKNGSIDRIVVRENGNVVDEARRKTGGSK